MHFRVQYLAHGVDKIYFFQLGKPVAGPPCTPPILFQNFKNYLKIVEKSYGTQIWKKYRNNDPLQTHKILALQNNRLGRNSM